MIQGACVSSALNQHGVIVDPAGMVVEEMPVPLSWNHGSCEVGEIVWLRALESAVFFRATIGEEHHDLWRQIKSGIWDQASIGFDPTEESQLPDGTPLVTKWRLGHISIVPSAADPLARFEVYRNVVQLQETT